ncbi:hypothetical protein CAK95_24570 [Pseudorhodoplanes sinuspersici]|uniref:Uncharacterized protein n=2 Tax=Pseudorhodoplanes sinuspersici TaxID=1235591 RepID=A0A1W6ZXB3_9HYPH|nr:hypothetical protein CAK95_24570 [Pseudorhodoplanes sinuspersici]
MGTEKRAFFDVIQTALDFQDSRETKYRAPEFETARPLLPRDWPTYGELREIGSLVAALQRIAKLRYAEHTNEPFDEALDIADQTLAKIGKPIVRPYDAQFNISDDGIVTATAAWKRDNEATICRLLLTSVRVSDQDVFKWRDDQVREADCWALAVHFSASDNDDIKVPPKPTFLPDYEPFTAIIPEGA